jgi:hypothetical protein
MAAAMVGIAMQRVCGVGSEVRLASEAPGGQNFETRRRLLSRYLLCTVYPQAYSMYQ